jgi:hypothetical protein
VVISRGKDCVLFTPQSQKLWNIGTNFIRILILTINRSNETGECQFVKRARANDKDEKMTGLSKNKRSSLSDVELSHWKEKIHDIPDVRLDRVLATRQALQDDHYDSEQILEDLINKLSCEMDIDESCEA